MNLVEMVLGFSLKVENLQITFDIQGVDQNNIVVFQKTVMLAEQKNMISFAKDYVNKNWSPLFKFLNIPNEQVNRIVKLNAYNFVISVV